MSSKQQNTTQKVAHKQNQQDQKSVLSFGLGLVFFVVVLFSLITISCWLTQQFVGQESVPVTSIVISGSSSHA